MKRIHVHIHQLHFTINHRSISSPRPRPQRICPCRNQSWNVGPVINWHLDIQPTRCPLGHTQIHVMRTHTRPVVTRHPRCHILPRGGRFRNKIIKYTNRCDADHILADLEELYIVTTGWTGSLYMAMHMAWDYIHHTVDISMPGYVAKALHRFQHHSLGRPQHSSRAWQKPQYGAHPQMTPAHDDSTILPQPELTRIQEIIGTLLFYGRAINSTMLVALGTIASKQIKGTDSTSQAFTQLLNYASAHPDATVRYHASDMCLHIHSDASYLSEAKAGSQAGGTFFLISKPTYTTKPSRAFIPPPPYSGFIHTISAIMANVMASATEAECGALFHNSRDAVPVRTALI
jgi:hypothetical protein